MSLKRQIRHMLKSGGGVIVNTASIAGKALYLCAAPSNFASKHTFIADGGQTAH